MEDTIVGVLVIAGAAFVALAGIGVVRLDDVYARMHAGTKASTIAVVLVTAGATVALDGGRWKLLLTAGVLFVTAPCAAHLIGRAIHGASGMTFHLDEPDDMATPVDRSPEQDRP